MSNKDDLKKEKLAALFLLQQNINEKNYEKVEYLVNVIKEINLELSKSNKENKTITR